MTSGSLIPFPMHRVNPRRSLAAGDGCDVVLREISLLEGVQRSRRIVRTDAKLHWCRAIAAAGVREIETGALVPNDIRNQFQDTSCVLEAAQRVEGVVASILVSDLAEARRALGHKAQKVIVPVSAGEAFSRAHLGRTRDHGLADFRAIVELARANPPASRPYVAARVSVAFGCPIEGDIPVRDVARTVYALVEAGADEITLADSAGGAFPAQVRDVLVGVLPILGDVACTLHFRDIPGLGLGLANCLAGLDSGVRRFEVALNGAGGWPNSPGLSGNVATEDLVFMLHWLGLSTGIDPCELATAKAAMQAALRPARRRRPATASHMRPRLLKAGGGRSGLTGVEQRASVDQF